MLSRAPKTIEPQAEQPQYRFQRNLARVLGDTLPPHKSSHFNRLRRTSRKPAPGPTCVAGLTCEQGNAWNSEAPPDSYPCKAQDDGADAACFYSTMTSQLSLQPEPGTPFSSPASQDSPSSG